MSKSSGLIRKAVKLATERLGDKKICPCGATAQDMADKCAVSLGAICPGFTAYDAARSQALRDVGFFDKREKIV